MLRSTTYYTQAVILLTALAFSACEAEDNESESNAEASEAGTEEMMSANEAGDEANNEAGSEAGTEEAGSEMTTEGPWGEACVEDSDCTAPTDFCVKQPGMSEGYCTYACTNNQECQDLEAPESWTCNTLNFSGCEDIPSNWCGPQSELTDFPGIIIECQ